MEHTLQAKYGDFSKYDAFMDDNMGLWANDLDPYVKAFQVSITLDLRNLDSTKYHDINEMNYHTNTNQ